MIHVVEAAGKRVDTIKDSWLPIKALAQVHHPLCQVRRLVGLLDCCFKR
jgi:hypothetical protein